MQLTFEGHVILVTGGTKGTGRGIASRFAELGATVAVCARNTVDDLPPEWTFEAADLRDAEQASGVVDRVVERFGHLDVLVNNAGGAPPTDTSTVSPRFTERVIALNLLAAVYVSQRANTCMQDQPDGGSIINIGSITSLRPAPTVAAYGAAKAGLASYTTTAGQEWAPKVRVNCVTVSAILTELAELHYGDAESIARIEQTIPMGRLATPEDVANACVFFASPLASYVTGANLVLHGGGDRPAFLAAKG